MVVGGYIFGYIMWYILAYINKEMVKIVSYIFIVRYYVLINF